MEIGSFIEWEFLRGKEYYGGTGDIARLNSGRAGIYHAARCLYCSKVWLPRYLCEAVRDFLGQKGMDLGFYDIDEEFAPVLSGIADGEAVVLTNYFGIMSCERMERLSRKYPAVIIDNAQAFFARPVPGCMNVYSARKFIGAPDGAYVLGPGAGCFLEEYPPDHSSDTSLFLLLRVEYGCEGKAYDARCINEKRIEAAGVKRMSELTRRILDGTDYEYISRKRCENFRTACSLLDEFNNLNLHPFLSGDCVPMVYPLLTQNPRLVDELLARKHFQGRWWSYLFGETAEGTFERRLSRCLMPVTIDQRYGREELEFIADTVRRNL